MGNYNITFYDLMYRFKRVKRFNRYTIYYDYKNMNYFRNNHIYTPLSRLIASHKNPSL